MKKAVSLVIALFVFFNFISFAVDAKSDEIYSSTETETVGAQTEQYDEYKGYEEHTKSGLYSTKLISDERYNKTVVIEHTAMCDVIYNLSYFFEFDSIVIEFLTSNNINLLSDSAMYLDYSDNGNIFDVEFSADENSISKDLSYDNTDTGWIYFTVSFITDGQTLQTLSKTIDVLITPYGDFVSTVGIEVTDKYYCNWLYENNLISYAVYKEIDKNLHMAEYSIVYQDALTMEQIQSEINNRTLAAGVKYASGNKFGQVSYSMVPLSGSPQIRSGAIITYTIAATESGEKLNIYGCITWTDVNSGEHPAKGVKVVVYDENPGVVPDYNLAEQYTDEYGEFYFNIDNNTNIIENGYDIYVRAYAILEQVIVGSTKGNNTDSYHFRTPTVTNVKTTQPTNCHYTEGSNEAKAFYIVQAFTVGLAYVSSMNNGNNLVSTSHISVVFPHNETEYSSFEDEIHIENDIYCFWDVVLHEHGHYVSKRLGICDSPGGEHIFFENLADRYGKQPGIKLAWSEGFSNYFGVSALLHVPYDGTSIPYAGDIFFDTLDIHSIPWRYGLNETLYSNGEDNEMAVACLLYVLVHDNIFSYQEIWNIAKNNNCVTLSEFMEALYNSVSFQQRDKIGQILERQKIAARINTYLQYYTTNCPTFSWNARIGSTNFPNKYVLYICDFSGANLTSFIAGSNTQYVLNTNEWNNIINKHPNGFYWYVGTFQDDSPFTGMYYSRFGTAYIQSVETTLYSNYIGSLGKAKYAPPTTGITIQVPTNSTWYKFTAPSNGNYIFQTTYSELGVDTYGEIFSEVVADGVTAGRMAYNDNSGYENNFYINYYLNSGQTIYIRVRGLDENKLGKFIFNISYDTPHTDIQLNNIYSQTTTVGSYNWSEFTAPYTGQYIFYSNSNFRVVGELFNHLVPDTSTSHRIVYNTNYLNSSNFLISYYLDAGQTVYLRTSGYGSNSGTYQISVNYTPTSYINLNEFTPRQNWNTSSELFKFVVPESGVYEISGISGSITSAIVYSEILPLYSYDSEYTIGYDNEEMSAGDFQLTVYLNGGSTIYIQVSSNSSYSVYINKYTEQAPDPDDIIELTLWQNQWFYLYPMDTKWFKVTANYEDLYSVLILNLGNTIKWRLYSNEMNQISDECFELGSFEIQRYLEENETIYIRLDSQYQGTLAITSKSTYLPIDRVCSIDSGTTYDSSSTYVSFYGFKFIPQQTGYYNITIDTYGRPLLHGYTQLQMVSDYEFNIEYISATYGYYGYYHNYKCYLTAGQEYYFILSGDKGQDDYASFCLTGENIPNVYNYDLELGILNTKQIGREETKEYSFTAPQSGTYSFSVYFYSGESGYCYYERWLYYKLDDQFVLIGGLWEYESGNIVHYLSEGETVYLRVRSWGGTNSSVVAVQVSLN